MNERVLIFDASTLISLSMAGLLNELKELKKNFNGKFVIPYLVKKEIIDKPIKINRFRLEAMKLQELVDDKTLEFPTSLGINRQDVESSANEILNMANSLFVSEKDGQKIHLIDLGECGCLALSKILDKKGIQNVIAIDERTTRSLTENPEELKSYLEGRLHTRIKVNQKAVDFFKSFKYIRSTELIYVAYKKGLMQFKNGGRLEALLYALKYKGAAISGKEIQELSKMKNL